MNVTIKLYTNKLTKNGYPVVLYASGKNIRKRIATGLFFHSKDWDFEAQLPLPTAPNFKETSSQILSWRGKIIETIYQDSFSITDLERIIRPKLEMSESYYGFAEELQKEMIAIGKISNAETYRVAIDQLKKNFPTLTFSEVTHVNLTKFKTTKRKVGVSNTTIHGYLRTYRAIYNKAVDRELIKDKAPFRRVFKDLPLRNGRNQKKWLTIESIKELEEYVPERAIMRFVKDLFLLQFYLGGQDLVDIWYMKHDELSNNRWYLKRKKLGDKGRIFDVRVFPKAQEIIDRYKSDDSDYVFKGDKGYTEYKTFRRKYQTYLVKIQQGIGLKVCPNNTPLGIKVARHTFANRGKSLFINSDVLREIMGHERVGDIDTLYKDIFPENIRDKSHLKIIKIKPESGI